MEWDKKEGLMLTTRATIAYVSVMLLVLAAGCTDPAQSPTLASISPNPVHPLSTAQQVHFYGANQDAEVYYIMDTGGQQLSLDPGTAPGEWTFRCIFGLHFIYTFDSLETFLSGLGNPPELEITAYNVGANLVNENGSGDDLPSDPVSWVVSY